MKKNISFTSVLVLLTTILLAQAKPVKIVFDVTSKDTLIHQAAVRHATLESQAHPDAQLEIVIYSGALNMVVKDKSVVTSGVQQLTASKNVAIMVCAETMKRNNVDKSQLIAGVQVVPDGILEIVKKQGEGWGYIKEAH
jgi:intracellular sulfur oxidation DsrE/DsrF family protein